MNVSERLKNLEDYASEKDSDYEKLKGEVLEFFKNVKNGRDLEACIEEFEIGLSNYCDIEVVEEIGFSKSNNSLK